MKKKILISPLIVMGVLLMLFGALKTNAQNYEIKFAATGGAVTDVETVKVENLSKGTKLSMSGSDILHLGSVGINEKSLNRENVKVYPNPTHGEAELSFYGKEAGEIQLYIYDVNGKVVAKTNTLLAQGSHKYRISGLPNGMYFINIIGNNYSYITKLISQNITSGEASITYMGAENLQTSFSTLKSSGNIIDMEYTVGDEIRFTGYSGKNMSEKTDSPKSNKTISFDFTITNTGNSKAWTCGTTLTVTHTAGSVAPVNKTVNYGTVETGIAGTGYKCWITQNLGADRQAQRPDDRDEVYAGWYWQFNRKQGYMHNGTTRTPNTNWITPINEDCDWKITNDPCNILLGIGSGWRIPTKTEWFNADVNGSWNNFGATYNSVLKLHAAGLLRSNDGSLAARGEVGYYWSSAQRNSTNAYALFLNSSESLLRDESKAYGFSLRCIKDECPTANAGADQKICGTSVTLAGNNPAIGTGQWSVVSGSGGSFGNASAYNSTFTGTANTSYILRWTISLPSCGTSTDDVVVNLNWGCGCNLTVNHIAGTVAAVTKNNVSYGTVLTNLSGANKCWITKNLGADVQANSPTDNREVAAGWYWQFNRKQGYEHKNGIRTPNSTWITTSPPSGNWTIANDPCNIELGSSWRIPTRTEWTNADATGGWNNYNDAYNSVLKLHAAGKLNSTDGALSERESKGYYWSSTSPSSSSFVLWLQNTSCYVSDFDKITGISLRCIKSDCTTANAGADTVICGRTTILQGNNPIEGTGLWTIQSANPSGSIGYFDDPSAYNSPFTGTAGTYVLRWTISNPPCPDSYDEVTITFNTIPTNVIATATPNPICVGSTLTLTGTANGADTWSWTKPDGFIANTQIALRANVTTAHAGVYTLTASNMCGSATAVNTDYVTVNTAPTITLTSATGTNNQTINCNTAITDITYSITGVGTSNIIGLPSGVVGILGSGQGGATLTISGTPTVMGTFNYTITLNNLCGTTTQTGTITVLAIPTVSCGTQYFMTKNMNTGTQIIPGSTDQAPGQKYCYNNVAANCDTYGGLYQWASAMNLPSTANVTQQYGQNLPNCDPCGSAGVQGICPTGFHIPTDLEWSRYEYCLESSIAPTGATSLATFQTIDIASRGTNSTAGPGAKMKGTDSNFPLWSGTNTSGFSALPAGWLYPNVFYNSEDGTGYTYFWTATEAIISGYVYLRQIVGWRSDIYRSSSMKRRGHSVRCIQN